MSSRVGLTLELLGKTRGWTPGVVWLAPALEARAGLVVRI